MDQNRQQILDDPILDRDPNLTQTPLSKFGKLLAIASFVMVVALIVCSLLFPKSFLVFLCGFYLMIGTFLGNLLMISLLMLSGSTSLELKINKAMGMKMLTNIPLIILYFVITNNVLA